MNKSGAINWVNGNIKRMGLVVDLERSDFERPWGAFWAINKATASIFLKKHFPEAREILNISPKILLVEPKKKLSLQYHNRRRERWKIISGPVEIVLDGDKKVFNTGDLVEIENKTKHRLIGLNDWGVVAEIWEHVDINYPSDELDIVRLEDDFGR